MRDRSIDALRVVAILGVVGGHWLVTGLVIDPDGTLRQASPLAAMPAFTPVSWVLQTLGLFFFAGGFAAARSRMRDAWQDPIATTSADRAARTAGNAAQLAATGRVARSTGADRGRELRKPPALVARALRAARTNPARGLWKPLATLVGCWTVALVAAAVAGVPTETLRTIATLVLSPLWFLLPYLALRLLTGPIAHLVDRYGPALALAGVPIVAASDLGLVPGWLAVPAAWSVPWVLGVALARGRLTHATPPAQPSTPPTDAGLPHQRLSGRPSSATSRLDTSKRAGVTLTLAGALTLATLINFFGYPASAVGIPGATRSNLDPPSLATLALAITQIGVFLIFRQHLSRFPDSMLAINERALPIYLGHQSVLVTLAAAVALLTPHAPGLLDTPVHPGWVLDRLAWMPLLSVLLAALVRFRSAQKGGDRHRRRARAH